MLINQLAAASIPVANVSIPKEGPKCVPLNLDFAAASTYSLDFLAMQARGVLSMVQTLWVDNSASDSVLTINIDRSQQTVKVPASEQGYYPVLVPNPARFTFASSGGVACTVILINVPIAPGSWGPSAAGAGILLQTNSVDNGDQEKLNLSEGSGITLTDDGFGNIEIDCDVQAIALKTNGSLNDSQTLLDLSEGTGITLTESGGVVQIDCTVPDPPTLKTNGVDNGSQSVLNLKQGANVTITDDGSGGVTIAASGGGGGSVSLPTDDFYALDSGSPGYAWPYLRRVKLPVFTGFTWINQGGATIAATKTVGAYRLNLPPAADGFHAYVKTVPATPYNFTALLSIEQYTSTNLEAVGLCLADNANKLIVFVFDDNTSSNTGFNIGCSKYTNPTTFSAHYRSVPGRIPNIGWMRISDDGATRSFSLSADGVNWVTFYSGASNDFLTPTKIGFVITNQTVTGFGTTIFGME